VRFSNTNFNGSRIRHRKHQKREEKRLEKWLLITTIAEIMRFILIDKIISLESGKAIKTVKSVSLAEEYLADHFPTFPVLPGVLLLEGLIESASWLVREAENFAHSMILLEEARNVKYKSFVAPGAQIEYTVEAKTIEENISSFSGFGLSGGEQIVEAKFGLRHFNLADKDSAMAATDAKITENIKRRWELLR
jgi:3-hydroxyacyl-[acyl-carrier-protein] dehydratase